jgi:hypothetical protein
MALILLMVGSRRRWPAVPQRGLRTDERFSFRGSGAGYTVVVPLGTSIFLIAAGAILRYAVTAHVSGISLTTVGLILIIVGIAGVLLSLLYMFAWSPRQRGPGDRVVERDTYREPPAY